MNIFDFECCYCGTKFEVVEMSSKFYVNNNFNKIYEELNACECPNCGCLTKEEKHIDDFWEE